MNRNDSMSFPLVSFHISNCIGEDNDAYAKDETSDDEPIQSKTLPWKTDHEVTKDDHHD